MNDLKVIFDGLSKQNPKLQELGYDQFHKDMQNPENLRKVYDGLSKNNKGLYDYGFDNFQKDMIGSKQDTGVFAITPEAISNINQKSGSNFSTNPKDVERYNSFDEAISIAAKEKGEDPNLIKFLMMQESRMKPAQTSPAGYYGLAQTNKATIATVNKNFGTSYKLADMDHPEKAARFMADYIKLAKKFGAETWDDFIVAYNRGIGHIKTHKEGGEHPPETQKYLQSGAAYKDTLDEEIRRQEPPPTPPTQKEPTVPEFSEQELQTFQSIDSNPRLLMGQDAHTRNKYVEYKKLSVNKDKYEITPEERGDAKTALLSVEDILQETNERIKQLEPQATRPGRSVLGGAEVTSIAPEKTEIDRELTALYQKKSLIKNAKQYYEAVAKGDTQNGIERFWMGAKTLDLANVATFGIKDMLRGIDIAQIATKLDQEGEAALTQDEKDILVLHNVGLMAQQLANEDRAFAVGSSVAETVPFIADMMLFSGTGASIRAATYKGTANVIKDRGIRKVVSNLSDATARSFLFPMTYEDLARRMSPEVGFNEEMQPVVLSSGEDFVPAMLKSSGNTAVEIFSEGAVGAGLSKAVNKLTSKGAKVLKNTKVGDIIEAVDRAAKNSPVLKMASIQDPLTEFGEEVFAGVVQPIITGEGSPLDFFEYENMIRTGLTVLVMNSAMTAPSAGVGLIKLNGIRKGQAVYDDLSDENKAIFADAASSDNFDDIQAWVQAIHMNMLDNIGEDAPIGDITKANRQLINLTRYLGSVQKARIDANKIKGASYQFGDKVYTNSEEFFKQVDMAIEKGSPVPYVNIRNDETSQVLLDEKVQLGVVMDKNLNKTYREVSREISRIPIGLEKAFAESLKAQGIELEEGQTIQSIVEDEAVTTPEKLRTPEQKRFVEKLNAAIKDFKVKNEERLTRQDTSLNIKNIEKEINFNKKEQERLTAQNNQFQQRRDELSSKEQLTNEDATELQDLETSIGENQEKLTILENNLPNLEKKLAELKSQKPDLEESSQQPPVEKLPKSETEAEQVLPKSETSETKVEETAPAEKEVEAAKKAKISPKNFADLVRVGKELFGLSDSKAYASAVIMDLLIRNQAKRDGISVQEMYDRYEFRKTDTKSLEDAVKDETIKEQLRKGKLSPAGAFFTEDGKLIVNAITNPNVSTPMHEMAHAFEGSLTKAERDVVLRFAKAEKWDKTVSEKFAVGFERYLQEGKAPSTELQKIFDQFRDWLIEIYNALSPFGIRLNPEMRKVYDAMLGAEQKVETKKEAPKTEVKEQPQKDRMEAEKTEEGEVRFQTIKVNGVDTKVKPVNADVVNGFYSPLEKVINETKLEKLPAKQWLDKFGRGEEAKWTGLQDWLIQQTGSISKSDIQKFLKENRVQIVEKVLTDPIEEYENQIRAEEQKIREDLLKPYEGNPLQNYHFVFDARDSVSEIIFVGTKEQAKKVESKKAYYASDTLKDLPSGITDKKVLTEYLRPSSKKLYDLRNKRDELVESPEEIESAKFMRHTEKGEFTDYKEILVLLPSRKPKSFMDYVKEKTGKRTIELSKEERDRLSSEFIKEDKGIIGDNQFKSTHFEDPNILVHLRMNTRKDVDGNKVLFLEEIQSDWGQKGRKEGFKKPNVTYPKQVPAELPEGMKWKEGKNPFLGDAIYYKLVSSDGNELSRQFATKQEAWSDFLKYDRTSSMPNTPAAPFVTDTNSWIKLGFKVALKEAVKQKVKKIAWTTGIQQVNRYENDLRKQVDQIDTYKEGDKVRVYAIKDGDAVFDNEIPLTGTTTISDKKVSLDDVLGKSMASKVREGGTQQTFKGNTLTIGGEGMKAFYGDGNNIGIIGKVIESVTKQKVGETKIKDTGTQHSIEVTPDLTQQVEEGLPLFQTPSQYNLSSLFPRQTDAKKQKTQDGILKRLQANLDDAIRYIQKTIGKIPDNAKFIQYNGKIYAVIELKVGGKKGFSVKLIEEKDGKGKAVVLDNNVIKKNVLSAAENQKNIISKQDALGRVEAYLQDYFKKEAEDSIARRIGKVKVGKRPKTPVELKPISSVEDLIERIKIERNAVKDFQETIRGVRKMIKESYAKKFITSGQFLSIMRRLDSARSEIDRSEAIEYTQNIISGAEFKLELKKAKKFIRDLKGNANKIGTGQDQNGKALKDLVGNILQADLSTLTYEDLITFNQIAAKIDIKSRNPRVYEFSKLESVARTNEVEEIEREPATINDIIDAIDKYTETYVAGELDERKKIVAAQRALNRLRRRADEVLNKHTINTVNITSEEQSDISKITAAIGQLVEGKYVDSELQAMIDQERDAYVEEIVSKMDENSAALLEAVSKLNPESKKKAYTLMTVKRADLDKLNLVEIESFDRFIDNLIHGYLNPAAAELDYVIGKNRLKENTTNKFFENIRKSKILDKWNKKYHEGRDSRIPFSDKAYDVQQLLQKQIWGRQAHRIDTWLGNFDKDHTIGSVYNFIGRGISMESITTRKFDNMLMEADMKLREMFATTITPGTRTVRMSKSKKDKYMRMRRWIGMLLAEKSYQATDIYMDAEVDKNNASIMHNNYVGVPKEKGGSTADRNHVHENNKRRFLENQRHYNAFMDFLRENNATKTVDGIEIMDTAKAEALLRKDAAVGNYIDVIGDILEGMRGMAEWSAFSNGRTFIELDEYYPFVVRQDKRLMDIDRIRDAMNIGRVPTKMQAGATYQRSGAANYLEVDPQAVMTRYIEEIARNYHVYGEMKKAMSAIMESGDAARDADISDQKSDTLMGNLTKTLIADLKLRIDMHYGLNSFAWKASASVIRRFTKAVKIGLLAKVTRPFAEMPSNMLRAFISLSSLPNGIITESRANGDVYESLIEDYIGERYMSRYGEELRGRAARGKVSKTMEEWAKTLVTISDTTVGRPLFINEFRQNFKKLTGQEFNADKFREDVRYRVENEQFIERSATRGVRKVEELFNEKAPLTAPAFIKFWGGLVTLKRNTIWAEYFGFLMSFNRNEADQFVDSVRRLAYSPYAEDKWQGAKDILAIISSNAMYGALRTINLWGLEWSISAIMELVTGDDKEDPWLKERKDKLFSIAFLRTRLLSSMGELALGGSSQLTLYVYKVMMYAVERTALFNKADRDKIKNFMASELYVKHIPAGAIHRENATQQAVVAALPVPSALTEDVFKMIDDAAIAANAIEMIFPTLDFIEKEVDDKEALYALASLVLTAVKIKWPSPFTPTAIYLLDKDRKKYARDMRNSFGDPLFDSFKEEWENSAADELLNEELKELQEMSRRLGLD